MFDRSSGARSQIARLGRHGVFTKEVFDDLAIFSELCDDFEAELKDRVFRAVGINLPHS
jgi:hypothetical protein